MISINRGGSDSAIIHMWSNVSPNNGSTYYLGGVELWIENSPNILRYYVPRAGTITKAYIFQLITPTVGSTETSTVSIRLNNTTDYTILDNTFQNDQATELFSNTAMSVPIAEGDYIEIKWVCPTWITKPTVCYISVTLCLE